MNTGVSGAAGGDAASEGGETDSGGAGISGGTSSAGGRLVGGTFGGDVPRLAMAPEADRQVPNTTHPAPVTSFFNIAPLPARATKSAAA